MKFNWRSILRRGKPPATTASVQVAETQALTEPRDDFLPEGSEMSFLDHLEDLRWTIIKGVGGVLIMTIIAAIFNEWVVDVILMGPARSDFITYQLLGLEFTDLVLQNRTVTGQFFAFIGIVMAVGLVAGSPILIYYVWKFIEPGLYPKEKAGMKFIAAFATFFFVIGVLFGYLVITPLALNFFNNFVISDIIINEFDITRYFSSVTWWAFGAGLLFELPVVIYFLAKLGIATPDRLRKLRKYAFLGVFVIGAFVTPADPFSMFAAAIPLYLLYEGSILVASWTERKRIRELNKVFDDTNETPKHSE
ncbi:MAG: twin-arginine translocase subunit TatC [Bacteroidetes bacterium]|nr:twin-arginine translocase subunit TatC [Bacteroidota bacterium]MCY4223676.1 twin-arginine translocase subunit TatC [Bacteroidota bacterium]